MAEPWHVTQRPYIILLPGIQPWSNSGKRLNALLSLTPSAIETLWSKGLARIAIGRAGPHCSSCSCDHMTAGLPLPKGLRLTAEHVQTLRVVHWPSGFPNCDGDLPPSDRAVIEAASASPAVQVISRKVTLEPEIPNFSPEPEPDRRIVSYRKSPARTPQRSIRSRSRSPHEGAGSTIATERKLIDSGNPPQS
jgi:hypothetical protein